MANYRAFPLNSDGQIWGPPSVIDAETDEAAIDAAKKILRVHGLELCQADRIVATLKSSKLKQQHQVLFVDAGAANQEHLGKVLSA